MATKVNGLIQKVNPGNDTQYSIASTAYGYCQTAAATAAKVVDMTGFTLLEGTTIHVKFQYANTAANPTLNVNGTGAKAIVLYGTTAAGTTNSTSGWQAGAVVSLTYDGENWVRDQGYNTNDNTTYQFDGTYNSSSNKAATVSSITTRIATAIGALDGTITGTAGTGATVTALSETDGKVSATFSPISITKSQISDFPSSMTPTSHTHGNITNDGKLGTASRIVVTDSNKNITVGSINPADIVLTNDTRLSDSRTPKSHTHGNISNDGKVSATATIATGDRLLIVDSDTTAGNTVTGSSITFDGSTKTKALTQAGTWETFNNYSHPTSSGNKHIPAGGSSGQILRWSTDGTAAWGADNDTKYTAGSGLTLSSANQFSIGSGAITNAMLAGSIENGKLVNSKVTIAGNDVSLGGSLSVTTLKTSLGLNSALHYIGKTSTALSDGATTSPIAIGSTNVTPASGDIVIDSNENYEYIWNGSKWEAFGPEGSYKVKQEAVTDPTAGTSGQINFIDSISQNANGEISVTKQPVRSASTTQTGVTQYTAANLNTWIGQLPTWTATPTDTTKLIRQDTGGAVSYGQVTFSTVYDYIKNKLAITNAGATLAWGSAVKVATIGSTDINVKLPANPNTDRYVNAAAFADNTTSDAANPVKMTLTRAGSDTATVTATIPKVSSSSAGVVPKGASVTSQSQSTKFLREDGTWAAPSYTTNTNTHYVTHLYVGSGTAANATTTNGNTKLALFDDSTSRNVITIKGTGTTTVTSDADGVITINSADSKTGTVTKITAGTGLNTSADQADNATKGSITTTGTLYLTTSGVTATTYGNTTQQTPSHGGTFNIPYFTVDKYGRVTNASTTTVKLPADNNTDTKVNVKARGTTKAYIMADTTSPTSSAAAHEAVAETAVYMDTTAGAVAATSYKVAEKVILQYNTTTDALDFVFV